MFGAAYVGDMRDELREPRRVMRTAL